MHNNDFVPNFWRSWFWSWLILCLPKVFFMAGLIRAVINASVVYSLVNTCSYMLVKVWTLFEVQLDLCYMPTVNLNLSFKCKSKISPQGDQSTVIVMLLPLFHFESKKSVGGQLYLVKLSTYSSKTGAALCWNGSNIFISKFMLPYWDCIRNTRSWRDRCNRWTFILGSKIEKVGLITKAIIIYNRRDYRGHPGLNRGQSDLQSDALPLSYAPRLFHQDYKNLMKLIAN